MLRDPLLYHAALLPPTITDPIIRLCIRPTAAPITTVTTDRPPLTTRGTTILPEVLFLFTCREGLKDVRTY